MTIVPLSSTWHGLIDPEWLDELDSTPFLTRCRTGEITKTEMHTYVRQQYFYSRYFTRYLCGLLFNIEADHDRLELTQNLFEEMGLGEFGNIPHSAIYRQMMEAMGVHPDAEPEFEATSQLVETMLEACTNSNPMIGLAALGLGAEAVVPHLYSQIILGLRSLDEPEENLEFFKIHVEGDDEHAVTMKKILEREITKDPFQRLAVRNTARKILKARAKFFAAIKAVDTLAIPAQMLRQKRQEVNHAVL